MSATIGRQLWRAENKYFVKLCLFSAFFSAFYRIFDNLTLRSLVTASDSLTAVLAYLVFAGWTGVGCSYFFCRYFGKKLIDPNFVSLTVVNKKMLMFAILAGILAALSTFFGLWANQIADPVSIISFGSMIVLSSFFYDQHNKQLNIKRIWFPFVLVLLGGIIASFCGSFKFTLVGFLLMGVLSNFFGTITSVLEQKGAREGDAVSLFFWRFLFLATVATFLSIVLSLIRGTLPLLFQTILKSVVYVPVFILTMFFVFLGMGSEIKAKKDGLLTIVFMITSFQVVFGYILTICGNLLIPGLFGEIPSSPLIWAVRIAGSILLILGIWRIYKIKTIN